MGFSLIDNHNLATFSPDNAANHPLLKALYLPLMRQESCILIHNVHVDTQLLDTGSRDTLAFLRNLLSEKIIRIKALWDGEKIVAFTGYFTLDGVMINPLIGYDRSYPQREGLYRLLTMETMLEAEKQGLLLNMSSGAAHFKRLRGAQPFLEYNLVYDRHLSFFRRLPWALTRLIAVPTIWLVRRYGL